MAIRPWLSYNENFNRLSRVHERYRRQTDGRTTTYSEHEHDFTFAKKRFELRTVVFFSRSVSFYHGIKAYGILSL